MKDWRYDSTIDWYVLTADDDLVKGKHDVPSMINQLPVTSVSCLCSPERHQDDQQSTERSSRQSPSFVSQWPDHRSGVLQRLQQAQGKVKHAGSNKLEVSYNKACRLQQARC